MTEVQDVGFEAGSWKLEAVGGGMTGSNIKSSDREQDGGGEEGEKKITGGVGQGRVG